MVNHYDNPPEYGNQGVPYDNIEKTIAALGEHGLMTGGTGAKVRPVVFMQGNNLLYGLIDTFALSRKIHERFYVGYHDVVLPAQIQDCSWRMS